MAILAGISTTYKVGYVLGTDAYVPGLAFETFQHEISGESSCLLC